MFVIGIPFMLPVSDETHRAHAAAITKAILRSYGTIDAACIEMGVNPANFHKELTGERSINYTRLMKLGSKFFCWLPVFLAAAYGMPEELETADRLRAQVTTHERTASWSR